MSSPLPSETSTEPLVLYEKRGGIGNVTLNRPQALNAINLEMRDELWDIFRAVRDDPEVGVAIIAGAGERAFSAGADVKEFGSAPSYLAARFARHDRDLWGLLLSIEKPLIAAIQGFALGAGCEMSLCCDMRIAADDATFALPEVSLGYIPSAGGTQFLPRIIPPGVAMQMLLSGNQIDASEALRLGLVHRVVPLGRLRQEAEQVATAILSLAPSAIRYAKRALAAGLETSLPAGLEIEAKLALQLLRSGPSG